MTRKTLSAHGHVLAILTSLATLAFLGCDQTGPAGPELEAQFSHKEGHGGGGGGGGGDDGDTSGSSVYAYTHSGDLVTDPATANGVKNVGKGKTGDEIVMSGSGDPDTRIKLSATLVDALGATGCIPVDAFIDFSGAISSSGGGSAQARYFLNGKSTDGGADVLYNMEVTGTITAGVFPPAVGEIATIAWSQADLRPSGKKAGDACAEVTGRSLDAVVQITGVS